MHDQIVCVFEFQNYKKFINNYCVNVDNNLIASCADILLTGL